MSKYQKCDKLKEDGKTAKCNGNKMYCPKNRLKCHVTATCWKVLPLISCCNCRWQEICIDPCDGCPKFGETPCGYEQGDKQCQKIVAPTCQRFEPKKSGLDVMVERVKEKLS